MRAALLLAALLASGCTLGQARTGAIVAVVADLGTTAYAVEHGYLEGNPLLGDHPVATSAVISGALLGGAYLLEPYDPKGATWFYRFVAAVRGGMAVYNLTKILTDKPTEMDRKRLAPSVGLRVAW